MAVHEAAHADIYDPVRLSPEGSLFNRIVLEKLWDKEQGEPFNISNIQPQVQLRKQLRQVVVGQEEYYPGQANSLEHWNVIPDYPFQFLDEDHMRDYVNKLSLWIANGILMPHDLNALWKSINLLRLNCQYSDVNTDLFRSVNGFETLIGALEKHFYIMGLRNVSGQGSDILEMEEAVNLCREIVKLTEILGWSTDRPPQLSETLCDIMGILYIEGIYKKDIGRLVRIIHAGLYDVRQPLFNDYYQFICNHLEYPLAFSTELSLCTDVVAGVRGDIPPLTILPLSKALGTLVSRFCDDHMNNMVIEEYGDRCSALENVLKVMCQVCAKYGLQTVFSMTFARDCDVIRQIGKILKHALLHLRPGDRLFKGRHLLFALMLSKYIYGAPGVINRSARLEDLKIVLDFAMSNLATRYLFNGYPMLKDLAEEVVSIILRSQIAELLLNQWPDINALNNI